MALAAAKDLPQLSLVDALELTILVARKDPRRHPRVADPEIWNDGFAVLEGFVERMG